MCFPVFAFSSSGMPRPYHHEFNSCTETKAVFARIGELGLGDQVRCIAYHEYVDRVALVECADLHILWACPFDDLSTTQRLEIEGAWILACRNEPTAVVHTFSDLAGGDVI